EGLQVEIMTGAGQEGFQIFDMRGNDQVIAPARKQIKQLSAGGFGTRRLLGQHFLDPVRQEPAINSRHHQNLNFVSGSAPARPYPSACTSGLPRAADALPRGSQLPAYASRSRGQETASALRSPAPDTAPPPDSATSAHTSSPEPPVTKKPGGPGCAIVACFEVATPARRTSVASFRSGPLCPLEEPEELAVRIQHQHVGLAGEAFPISLQTAVEGVELRILVVRRRVDGRRLGITLTADLLGFAEGLGQNHPLLTISIGADTFSQLAALGAVFTSLPLTLRAHALEHAAVDFPRQIDGLDPHVQHLDAHLATGNPVEVGGDVRHQLVTLARHNLVQGAASHLVAQT